MGHTMRTQIYFIFQSWLLVLINLIPALNVFAQNEASSISNGTVAATSAASRTAFVVDRSAVAVTPFLEKLKANTNYWVNVIFTNNPGLNNNRGKYERERDLRIFINSVSNVYMRIIEVCLKNDTHIKTVKASPYIMSENSLRNIAYYVVFGGNGLIAQAEVSELTTQKKLWSMVCYPDGKIKSMQNMRDNEVVGYYPNGSVEYYGLRLTNGVTYSIDWNSDGRLEKELLRRFP